MNDNDVLRYMPSAVEGNEDFINLYKVQQQELHKLHNILKFVQQDCYIDTMSEDRLTQWEIALNTGVKSNVAPNIRRKDLKDILSFTPPITRHRLTQLLDDKYGKDGYYVRIFPDEFLIIIGVDSIIEPYIAYMYGYLKKEPEYNYQYMSRHTYSIWGKFRGATAETNASIINNYFKNFITKLIPANMQLEWSIKYMYAYIKGNYTYDDLYNQEFTYGVLSQYS